MGVDDAPGSLTVCSRGRSGFRADDLGVMVRGQGRVRRIAWSEISKFADGLYGTEAGSWWELQIVLRCGRRIPVECTRGASAAPEMLTTITQVAERYGIPADLTGVMIRDGRPPGPGAYEDPGGQAGLRYWDGSQWSPLLPLSAAKPPFSARKSTERWAALPVAVGPWTHAAKHAKLATFSVVSLSAVATVLFAAGLATGLESGDWTAGWVAFSVAGMAALFAPQAWVYRRHYLRIDKAVRDSITKTD